MGIKGVYRKILRTLKARTNQADKLDLFGVPIKTASWLPDDTGVMIYNGVDNVVRLDGTSKEAHYEVKKPRMVILHTGVTPNLAKWRLSQRLNQTVSDNGLARTLQDHPSKTNDGGSNER